MKKQMILIIMGVIALFLIIYMINEPSRNIDHPTLSKAANLPDEYLQNVAFYEKEDKHEMSAFSLEKAIESIWKIENDVDDKNFEKLELSIARLENVHRRILKDSVDIREMRSTFEYTLNNLALAELEIAEMYAETNHLDKANMALKYAMLHIKNALLFHNSFWDSDSIKLAIERHVFDEMDSLLENKTITPVAYIMTLDKMIAEVDEIIKREEHEN